MRPEREFMCSTLRLCNSKHILHVFIRIIYAVWFTKCTHHNTIGHEEDHPTEDMNHKEGHRQSTQVIILTAAEDIPVAWNKAKCHK